MEDCKLRNVQALNSIRNCKNLSRKKTFEFSDQLQLVLVTLNGLSDRSDMIEVTAGSVLSEMIDTLELLQSKIVALSKQKKIERFLSGNKHKKRVEGLLFSLKQLVYSLERIGRHTQSHIAIPQAAQLTPYSPIDSRSDYDTNQRGGSPYSPRSQIGSPQGSFRNMKLDIVWNHLFGEDSFAVGWEEFCQALREEGLCFNSIEETLIQKILDNSNTGCVTRNKLCEFLKSFGPLSDCVRNVVKITSFPWFHGYMTAEESRHYLEPETIGTFLVRFSNSKPGAFALDYVTFSAEFNAMSEPLYGPMQSVPTRLSGIDYPTYGPVSRHNSSAVKVVRSVLIESVGIGFKLKENHHDKVYKSLPEILNIYGNVLTKPFNGSLADESWFHGGINSDEAEEILRDQPPGSFLIRFSSQSGSFATSFTDSSSRILKSLIHRVPGGFTCEGSPITFRSIPELVDEFHKNGVFLYPVCAFGKQFGMTREVSGRFSFLSLGSSGPLSTSAATTLTSSPQSRRMSSRNSGKLSTSRDERSSPRFSRKLKESRDQPVSHFVPSNGPYRRTEVQLWKVDDVLLWLDSIELEDLRIIFKEHQINGIALLDLSELDMRNELKIVLGHRKKLLKALQDFM